MTPLEKAEELIRKYYTWGINKEGKTLSWFEAKQCALIAVDEVIKSRPKITLSQLYYNDYWQQVKQEIELL